MNKKTIIVGIIAGALLVGVSLLPSGAAAVNTESTKVDTVAGANNAGAIEFTSIGAYPGVIGSFYDSSAKATFAVFDTVQNSVLAIETILNNYFNQGLTSILQVASKYTTGNPGGNNVRAANNYLALVELSPMFAGSGIDVNSDISNIVNDINSFAYLIAGVTVNEGDIPLTSSQVLNYIQ